MGEWEKPVYLCPISFQVYADLPRASGWNLTDLYICQSRWKLSDAELKTKKKERKKFLKM